MNSVVLDVYNSESAVLDFEDIGNGIATQEDDSSLEMDTDLDDDDFGDGFTEGPDFRFTGFESEDQDS
jgi:hypothetical protein